MAQNKTRLEPPQKSKRQSSPGFVRFLGVFALGIGAMIVVCSLEYQPGWIFVVMGSIITLSALYMVISGKSPSVW
jgi:hypothetical protein